MLMRFYEIKKLHWLAGWEFEEEKVSKENKYDKFIVVEATDVDYNSLSIDKNLKKVLIKEVKESKKKNKTILAIRDEGNSYTQALAY